MKFDALKASLQDPTDDTDVTIVMDVASVGTTRKLSSGQTVKWTEEALQKFGPSLINTPINLDLKADGRAGDHSSNDIGTVREQKYDPERKTLTAIGTLWQHAHPATIAQLRKLYADKDVDVSMEFRAKELTQNEDGTETPAEGRFGGVGLVGGGADLGAGILLLASAMAEDEKKKVEPDLSISPVGSFEWIAVNAAEYLANNVSASGATSTVTATFPDHIIYTTTSGNSGNNSTYQINFDPTTAGNGTIVFGEPVRVSPTFVPLEGSRKEPKPITSTDKENNMDEKEVAELKASRDALETQLNDKTKELETLQAELNAEKEKQAVELKASARIEEIEKIEPYTDDKLKEEHRELFKTADDKTFDGIKKLVASMAELRGGIASEGEHGKTPQGKDEVETEALAKLPAWKEELKAHFAAPATK